eukprot:GHVU01024650.1.p1 GENE.GHVU01024650.1~~GHVU01024650.1.p1  ORF type:complete len:129 (-),score=15.67 GHVU01024650.1:213-599(-)
MEDKYRCRFYEREYPEQHEVVMTRVTRIEDMGVYVSLEEYKDMEGMILMSELSKRRIRSVQKLIKIGKFEAVMVQRVDTLKGYIDLSKKRVSTQDVVACEARYLKAKRVHASVARAAKVRRPVLNILY